MKKVLVIILGLLLVCLIYYIFFIFGFRGFSNSHIVVTRNLCEDNCPPEVVKRSWSKVYYGVENEKECLDVGGRVIPSYAFGGFYRACGVLGSPK